MQHTFNINYWGVIPAPIVEIIQTYNGATVTEDSQTNLRNDVIQVVSQSVAVCDINQGAFTFIPAIPNQFQVQIKF